ncbi:sigma-70 family RNA polymerase sigma factor [bacterium]|nr:sigma-70 family RNA polymerase sigma factor [bacterium]
MEPQHAPLSPEEVRLSERMRLAQKGDSQAYHLLLEELTELIEGYAQRVVSRFQGKSDPDFAGDIVQEVLLAIHDKRHTYDPEQRFLPWVFGIAYHKIVDWKRKHGEELKRYDLEIDLKAIPQFESEALDFASLNGVLSEGLQNLLSQLNQTQREVIELTKFRGWTVAETARGLGLSESNVKVITHRAVQSLRAWLDENEEKN